MMKRQLMRVKQIADQTFLRGEKTEVLTDELTAAEKRVELIKHSCHCNGKKLSSCMQRLAVDGASSERRSPKKIPEALLAQCMEEWGLSLGEGSILGMTLVDCARIQDTLAGDLLFFKAQVEETVVEPLQNILKIDISNVAKCRKQLTKLTADMDSAKMRYQTAVKNCQQVTGNGLAAAVSKAELLREESEDASNKVDQCRDALAADMFSLISREPELSLLFVKLCHLQAEYHKAALSVLESSLPELEAQIKSFPYHPVFGFPLEEHLQVTNREVAVVIETCVCWLLETAMNEEGLFRIGGSVSKIKKLKSAFDAGVANLTEDDRDPHNVAGVLKSYLRSLPEPLLTYDLYNDWMEAARISDHDTQLQTLWQVVNSLPEANFKNLRYLIKFLAKLTQNAEVNKMSSQNIAIVMGPNLLWSQVEETALGMNMTATNLHSSIVDVLITYADWFFPGDCEFYVSTPTTPRHLNGYLGSLKGSQLSLSTTTKLTNGNSSIDSVSSSPTNSPTSPSPRGMNRPRKKAAPPVPGTQNSARHQITRSVSCGIFQSNSEKNNSLQCDSLPKQMSQHELQLKRLSTLHSRSHENLLNINYNSDQNLPLEQNGDERIEVELSENVKSSIHFNHKLHYPSNCQNGQSHGGRFVRSPGKVNGLPPLMERSQRTPVERPSVPPPERPATTKCLSSSSTLHSDIICTSNSQFVDINDICVSLSSSGSEHFAESPISFMDDSDYDEEKSPLQNPRHILISDNCDEMKTPLAIDEKNLCIGGGTPNWFDHYSNSRRHSTTTWFDFPVAEESINTLGELPVKTALNNTQNSEHFEKLTDESSSAIPSLIENYAISDQQFCTVIQVGSSTDSDPTTSMNIKSKPPRPQSPPPATPIKLRVNSETQNTRL